MYIYDMIFSLLCQAVFMHSCLRMNIYRFLCHSARGDQWRRRCWTAYFSRYPLYAVTNPLHFFLLYLPSCLFSVSVLFSGPPFLSYVTSSLVLSLVFSHPSFSSSLCRSPSSFFMSVVVLRLTQLSKPLCVAPSVAPALHSSSSLWIWWRHDCRPCRTMPSPGVCAHTFTQIHSENISPACTSDTCTSPCLWFYTFFLSPSLFMTLTHSHTHKKHKRTKSSGSASLNLLVWPIWGN